MPVVIFFEQESLELARALRVAPSRQAGLAEDPVAWKWPTWRKQAEAWNEAGVWVQDAESSFSTSSLQVFGSRPTASAHDRDIVLGHEFKQVFRKRFGLERINGLTIHVERQSRVGDARNGQRGIFAEDADGLAHVLGAGGTVEADDVDAHAFEDGERGVDVGAEQHAAGRVERDLRLDRQIDLSLVEGFVDAGDGGFDFEDVLRGFDEEQVHAAADQTDGLFAEDIGEFVEGDVGKFGVIGGGKFAGWADGAGDKARFGATTCPALAVVNIHPQVCAQGSRRFR